MIIGVDHAQITVPKDAEVAARKFYCEFLGLIEIEKPENRKKNGGFWLSAGSFQVHLGLEDGFDRSSTKSHIAYQVSDLEIWRSKLRDAGIEIMESLPFAHARAFEFRDPFGNRVEMIEVF